MNLVNCSKGLPAMKKLTLLFILLLTITFHVGCGSSPEKEEGDATTADAESTGEDGGDVAADGDESAEGAEANGRCGIQPRPATDCGRCWG